MNSRTRVRAALERRQTDRVPIWMWLHPDTTRAMALALDIPPESLPDVLGDDIRQRWVGNNHAMEGIVHEREGETHTDPWGITWIRQGAFNQVARSPLAGSPAGELAAYGFPYGHTAELLASMDGVVRTAGEKFIGCDISPCLLELMFRVRGMEDALLDLAASADASREFLSHAADFSIHLAHEACARFPLDWLWTGDDVGSQRSMIVSPRLWRQMIGPGLARIIAAGKSHGLPVAYHSCGAIREIIPDLIAMGLDVLNPIQCNCPGMNPPDLKREFGASLAFMGGVDTQELLPRGTPGEVYRATRTLIDAMTADGGGYILAASHSVPPETPLENIFAMYDAAGVTREQIEDAAADIRARVGEP
ncbi:MAG TPA: uroporphyrinogen decarboxylase family protein [Bacteroidota bacterium]|nr:uroporphyrinogen decarboxylase family protein [Bacteroidota bacterium]